MPPSKSHREPAELVPDDQILTDLESALDPTQVAKQWGMHVGTVYRWMDRGVGGVRLGYLMIGGRKRRVPRATLEKFVREMTGRCRRAASTANASDTTAGCSTAEHAAAENELDAADWK